ncbi:MAG: tRNA (adenosine(37)-N6)-threonylcarbamoyltransferase complex dimerization subunit type 1 TsaB [Prevotellaceae bacterium]|nr:tRNA (adenosine(37)-N6)-threonylcarbamoyltransferase complex dimerization subunit type 1 TsaB [Prevotellaceae bacterium]
MAVILHIETSTGVCSTALSVNGTCLAENADFTGYSHAEKLSPFVQNMLNFARSERLKIDAVAVSCGPGSYTGLRIGVSTAKGLCYGLDIPLIAVHTLELLANTVRKSLPANALLCPMIDARRMEVYTALFDMQLHLRRPVSAEIIDENSFGKELEQQPVYFFGDGAEKCRAVITHANANFLPDIYPLAKNMIGLAEQFFTEKQFEDVAYFEPFYLKQFVATTPKNKIIS